MFLKIMYPRNHCYLEARAHAQFVSLFTLISNAHTRSLKIRSCLFSGWMLLTSGEEKPGSWRSGAMFRALIVLTPEVNIMATIAGRWGYKFHGTFPRVSSGQCFFASSVRCGGFLRGVSTHRSGQSFTCFGAFGLYLTGRSDTPGRVDFSRVLVRCGLISWGVPTHRVGSIFSLLARWGYTSQGVPTRRVWSILQ